MASRRCAISTSALDTMAVARDINGVHVDERLAWRQTDIAPLVCLSNNAAERALRAVAMRHSLCTPFSSVCEHWKLVFNIATRRPSLFTHRRRAGGPPSELGAAEGHDCR
jgi:hypothetical protein